MSDSQGLKSRLPMYGLIALLLAAVLAGGWFVWKSLSNKDQKPARTVQVVQIVRPPPPPILALQQVPGSADAGPHESGR